MENYSFHFSPYLPLISNLIRYFLFAGLAFLIVYKFFSRQFLKNKIQTRLAKKKDFLREIKHSIFSTLIFGIIGFGFIYSSLISYSQIYTNTSDFPLWWLPISVFLILAIQDTYFYWMHKAIHSPKLFKHIHRIHHQSTNPSPWAAYSFHFLEAILEAIIIPITVFIVPAHPLAILAVTFIAFFYSVYGHLGFEITPKWFRNSWLFEIMNTSVHHNLHHEKFNGNYGLYFRIWDRIMNTENPNYEKEFDRIQEKRFGKNSIHPTKISFQKVASYSVILLVLSSLFAFASKKYNSESAKDIQKMSIEGKWIDRKTNAIIEIEKHKDKFFGKVISSGNKEEDKAIEGKTVYVLNEFEESKDNEFCCGTIFLPRRKLTIDGKLTLIDSETLQIKASYGIFSHQILWEKIQ